ncbi:RHS repeat protein [Lachnobacterium bovis]|uniref:RHS repeat protein n=1 Tax=Lachnobacterium bovis TaxID=140626 RepID=UPI00048232E3|nr:RHS repeat protein [Lachnobacterium bovis]
MEQLQSFDYDDEKKTVTMTERNGAKSIHYHDEFYRNTKNVYPDGATISYEYDLEGNLIKITDAVGNYVIRTYDEVGQLTKEEIRTADVFGETDINGVGTILSNIAVAYIENSIEVCENNA